MLRSVPGVSGGGSAPPAAPPAPRPQLAASPSVSQPQGANASAKVAEVLMTAGHAFQRLGDLTLQLHGGVDGEESKWSEKDVEQLRDALTRFAHELDCISESVQARTSRQIRVDIKRRTLMPDDPAPGRRPASPAVVGEKRTAPPPSLPSGLAAKRIAGGALSKPQGLTTTRVLPPPASAHRPPSSQPPPAPTPLLQHSASSSAAAPGLCEPTSHNQYMNTR